MCGIQEVIGESNRKAGKSIDVCFVENLYGRLSDILCCGFRRRLSMQAIFRVHEQGFAYVRISLPRATLRSN